MACSLAGGCYTLDIEGGLSFAIWRVATAEAVIEVAEHQVSVPWAVPLLGPALILAFALLGTWCVHASAAIIEGEAVILLGESGAGKSTLAAALAHQNPVECRQIADDIVPMALERQVMALPHFPQLKLSPDGQPSAGVVEALPVSRAYVIEACEKQVPLAPCALGSREAALALVRHTLSARLFGRDLLADHFSFCGQVAERVPVWRLAYSHTLSGLEAACAALSEAPQTLPVPLTPSGR